MARLSFKKLLNLATGYSELSGYDLNAPDCMGCTILHKISCAAQVSFSAQDEVAIFHRMIALGADIHITTIKGNSILHYAAFHGKSTLCQVLLSYGASALVVNNHQQSALHWAAKNGNFQLIEALVNAGANPNQQNKDANTPFHCAAKQGYSEICIMFIKRGAVENRNVDGNTPLELFGLCRPRWIGRQRSQQTQESLCDRERVRVVLQRELNWRRRSSYGMCDRMCWFSK
jgi:ankyrin repeat protein